MTKISKDFTKKIFSPLCVDNEDIDLDLSSPLSYTAQTPGCSTSSRTESVDTLDLSAEHIQTEIKHYRTGTLQSSCSLDTRPLPASSDSFKFGRSIGSLRVTEELQARGKKRKYTEDAGPMRKRQKKYHFQKAVPDRGVKRKHQSTHTENALKRLKTWHWADPPSFKIPCPKTCACQVGQSRIIPITRRGDTETPLLKQVLKDNHYISACTSEIDCCENQCFNTWYW